MGTELALRELSWWEIQKQRLLQYNLESVVIAICMGAPGGAIPEQSCQDEQELATSISGGVGRSHRSLEGVFRAGKGEGGRALVLEDMFALMNATPWVMELHCILD